MFPDEFQYPEDRGQIYGEQDQEEAHFYFSLLEFENILAHYGPDFIFSRMSSTSFNAISDWFKDDLINTKEPCALLKKNAS